MIAYLVLGIGTILVVLSILYTYYVDQKLKKAEAIRTLSPLRKEESIKVGSSSILKESISDIGDDLDQLIDELRDKETEIRQIIKRTKKWQDELSDPVFEEILTKKMIFQKTDAIIDKYRVQAEAEISVVDQTLSDDLVEGISEELEPPEIIGEDPDKYDQIIGLAQKNLTIEEIARRLNLGYREVELVVKLRKKGASSGA